MELHTSVLIQMVFLSSSFSTRHTPLVGCLHDATFQIMRLLISSHRNTLCCHQSWENHQLTCLLSCCLDICHNLGDQCIETLIGYWSKLEMIAVQLDDQPEALYVFFGQQESCNCLSQTTKCFNLDQSLQSHSEKVT